MWNNNERLFGSPNVFFFGFARVALLYALDLLDLRPGENVLVPSFICDSALSPFNLRRVNLIFYPVKEDLRIDLEAAESFANEHSRALLAVNYFGFPQDYQAVKSFCLRRQLCLIEDNAHGFLSGDAGGCLGRYGNIAICSFRKSFTFYSGAALIINNPTVLRRVAAVPTPTTAAPALGRVAKAIVKTLDLKMGGHLLRYWNRTEDNASSHAKKDFARDEIDLNPYLISCSRYSRAVVRLLSVSRFRQAMRAKFLFWLNYCKRDGQVQPIWNGLPDGVVPSVFPLRATEPGEYIQRLHAETGVRASRWPRLPKVVRENIGDYPPFYTRVVTIPLDGEQAMHKPACFGSIRIRRG